MVVEGIIYRYRVGIPWRDLPECFGPWQTVWKRHRRYAGDGTWDRVRVSPIAWMLLLLSSCFFQCELVDGGGGESFEFSVGAGADLESS